MSAPHGRAAPYGPCTALIRRFLVRLAGLGALSRTEVVARHTALSTTPDYATAERLLGETIERSGRTDVRDAMAGPLLQLVQRVGVDTDATPLDALEPIAEPALAALLALLVADLLPHDVVSVLYAPFAETIPLESLGDP